VTSPCRQACCVSIDNIGRFDVNAMQTTALNPNAANKALIRRMVDGDIDAQKIFFQRHSDVIWRSCKAIARDEPACTELFREMRDALAADSFSRLASYDGRSSLSKFIAAILRQLLAWRLIGLLKEDSNRGGSALLHFFHDEIKREVAKYFDDARDREDAEHEVVISLSDGRLGDYEDRKTGKGKSKAGANSAVISAAKQASNDQTFAGFVITIIKNRVRDLFRRHHGRLRLPAAIEKLSELDREIFKEVFWKNIRPDPDILLLVLGGRGGRQMTRPEMVEALARVQNAVPGYYRSTDEHTSIDGYGRDQKGREVILPLDNDKHSQAEPDDNAVDALYAAIAQLSELEQQYLRCAMTNNERDTEDEDSEDEAEDVPSAKRGRRPTNESEPKPATIATKIGLPVEKVYTLKRQVDRKLERLLRTNPAVQGWLAEIRKDG
jgi:DNA-directed RNA polymerase specialized sigma24 family protein